MSVYRITLMETSASSREEVKYFPDTDARCVLNTFADASSRTPITSKEQLDVSMGKISKYLKDLKTHAFTDMDTGADNSPASSKKLLELRDTVNTIQTAVDNGKLKYATGVSFENNKLYLLNSNGTKLNSNGLSVVSSDTTKKITDLKSEVDNNKVKYGTGLSFENDKLYLLNINGAKLNSNGLKVISDETLKKINDTKTELDNNKLKYGTNLSVSGGKLYLLNMNGTKLNSDGVTVVSDVILKNRASTTVGAMWYE